MSFRNVVILDYQEREKHLDDDKQRHGKQIRRVEIQVSASIHYLTEGVR